MATPSTLLTRSTNTLSVAEQQCKKGEVGTYLWSCPLARWRFVTKSDALTQADVSLASLNHPQVTISRTRNAQERLCVHRSLCGHESCRHLRLIGRCFLAVVELSDAFQLLRVINTLINNEQVYIWT